MISIGHVEINGVSLGAEFNPADLPVIPTRNLVLFPGVSIPISLVRENSRIVAQQAKKLSTPIAIVCQLDEDDENPRIDSLGKYGVVVDIIDVISLPDNTQTALVRARNKVKILGQGEGRVIPEAEISASVKEIKEKRPKADDIDFAAICTQLDMTVKSILESQGSNSPSEVDMFLKISGESGDPVEKINVIATHLPLPIPVKFDLLATYRLKDRAFKLLGEVTRQKQMQEVMENVTKRAKESFDDQQRRMFLQRQMEAIDMELNGEDNEVADMRRRAAELNLSEKVRRHLDKELNKLERLNVQTPDYSVQYTYLETLLELPWNSESEVNSDFIAARNVLDSNHYGLNKIKQRILEQIAAIIYNPEGQSPILCLVGPPGVGKTSLGQSIASALGRKFQRVSLGGLHDEAEIRGHRRTYIGAMPGRIIDAVRKAGTSNPVILLDEVDKVGKDYKGDPTSALLEVLDPEQNCRFHDNYVDVDFDLSKVFFIATANTLDGVSQPLIDRMEVIDLSGYLLEEKVEIAYRHLLPKQKILLNLPDDFVNISRDAMVAIIENYTAESGVRQLEKAIASICRRLILKKLEGDVVPEEIRPEHLRDLLGLEKYTKDKYEGNDFVGVVTGLAWTAVGGEILYVESSLSKGKGERLTLTGRLGDVMKESATIALQYVKAHAEEIGIDPAKFGEYDLHIHVPEGAIPKDGPSAGITMATSIASAFSGRKVARGIAMTGEITLRGKVLPVGGVKEKILAAKRAGITDIILSAANRKDIEDIEPTFREGLTFHYVDTVIEVLRLALPA